MLRRGSSQTDLEKFETSTRAYQVKPSPLGQHHDDAQSAEHSFRRPARTLAIAFLLVASLTTIYYLITSGATGLTDLRPEGCRFIPCRLDTRRSGVPENSPLSDGFASLVIISPHEHRLAACLDGSPPGYYWRKGKGAAAARWIIHLEGGGWCYDLAQCAQRARTRLGSSRHWSTTTPTSGILSADPAVNPDFYDSSVVFVNYCDGGSFNGDVAEPANYNGHDVYFRGKYVLEAVMSSLMKRGLSTAKSVLLTGCSAGGLAVYYSCDTVRAMLPSTTGLKCMSDAGFFTNTPTVDGQQKLRALFQGVHELQNTTVSAPCIRSSGSDSRWKCAFPQYLLPNIITPVFVLNSAADTWSLAHALLPGGTHSAVITALSSADRLTAVQKFHADNVAILDDIVGLQSRHGVFVHACMTHCNSLIDRLWSGLRTADGVRAQAVFADWFFDRVKDTKPVIEKCAYPCNKNCQAISFA
eukprot:jgi/Chlat1/290/Chrsp1S03060